MEYESLTVECIILFMKFISDEKSPLILYVKWNVLIVDFIFKGLIMNSYVQQVHLLINHF